MRFSYHTEQWLPRPVEEVFTFFADPSNLPVLMPAWQSARIEHAAIVPAPQIRGNPPSTSAAGSGTRLTLSFLPIPHSPVRLRWEAEISEFVWNHHFCDRQLSGPFAFWKHCHSVQPGVRDGVDSTLVSDDVEYELPGGLVGRMAHALFLRRQIESTFAYRQCQLALLLPAVG